jgi:hypothetical protein
MAFVFCPAGVQARATVANRLNGRSADPKDHQLICAAGAPDFVYPNRSIPRKCLSPAVLERNESAEFDQSSPLNFA